MISEGSCDTEDGSNDAEIQNDIFNMYYNRKLHLNCNNITIIHIFTWKMCDQINAALFLKLSKSLYYIILYWKTAYKEY